MVSPVQEIQIIAIHAVACILLCTVGGPCLSRHTNFSSSPRTGHSRHSELIGVRRNEPSNRDPVDSSRDVVGIFKEN